MPPILRNVLAGFVVVLAACGGDGDGAASTTTVVDPATSPPMTVATTASATVTTTSPTTTSVGPRSVRPYDVEVVELPLVDTSRDTEGVDGEVVAGRALPTTLYLPEVDGAVPLIVFSHGFGASPAKFERLLGAWAAAGYAVAAPAFPLTSDLIDPAERAPGDVVNQPGDVVFLLDQLLDSEFSDRLDSDRLAAAGLSLGGLTTYIAAIDESTRDPRFTAAVVMAAVPPGDSFTPHLMPVMIMHGELDPVAPVASADAVFAELLGPAYEVTMLGAFHAEAFEDEEENAVFPDREQFHPIVDSTTTAFWDTYLLAEPTAEPGIAEAGEQTGITRFVAR